MLQLVEMEGRVTENGCIEIPMTVLDQTGICTGDAIKLIYMAEEEEVKSAAKHCSDKSTGRRKNEAGLENYERQKRGGIY